MLSFEEKKSARLKWTAFSKTEFGLILGATFTLSCFDYVQCSFIGLYTYKSCFISGSLAPAYSLRIPKL